MSGLICKFSFGVLVLCAVATIFCESVYTEWEYSDIPRPPKKLVPAEIMVDVTNDLGYRAIYYHSISDQNNFAFSPTALASVLMALYEASTGRSCAQIQNAIGLPWNRDIVRIGYRDIHRRLRTYFFQQENPLVGLSLNKENITITREYESILKFYGYDLGVDMISSRVDHDNKTDVTTEKMPDVISPPPSNVILTTKRTPAIITTITAEDVPEINTSPMPPKEIETTLLPDEEKPESTTMALEQITTEEEATSVDFAEQIIAETTTTIEVAGETELSQTTTESLPDVDTTIVPRTTNYIRTFKPIITSTLSPDEITTIIPQETPRTTRTSRVSSSLTQSALFPSRRRPESSRIKRHYPWSFYNSHVFEVAFAAPPQPLYDLELFNVDPIYFKPRDIGRNHIINHIFYLNQRETIQTTFKIYNSILNYNYIDSIRASVLELELDSKDYTLMLFIPDQSFGLDFLVSSLKSAPTLRVIRRSMQQKWVQAIVPDFHLEGKIFLTNDMQYLGISDIFEPLRADFSPMSEEDGIYVKHIEQSINVRIRTKPTDQLKRDIGPITRPIELSVNHPFLFFIVDKELDVATMAGSVRNPLNVRIQ